MTNAVADKATLTQEDQRLLQVGELLLEKLKDANKAERAGVAEQIDALKREFEARLDKFAKDVEERHPKLSLPGVNVNTDGKGGKETYSLARAAAFVATKDATVAPYELSVHNELRKKAMSFGIDSAGGFLVPSEVLGGLIDKLQAQAIWRTLGVREIQAGNVAPIRRNRKTGTTTAEWVGEMASAAKSQVKLAQMELSPKALSAKTDISNLIQMLSASGGLGGPADSMIEDDFAQQFALAEDRAVLIGANSEKGPVGVANTSGVLTSSSASLTYDKLVDFEAALRNANALFGTVKWAMTPQQLTLIRKLKDTSNQPLLWRDVAAGGPAAVLGYQFATTTQMGTTGANTLILGNWSQAAIYRWFGGMILKSTDMSDDALDNDVTRVVGRMYCDVGVEQPTAFCASSD